MSDTQERELPAASFSAFVASLAASALTSLGQGPGTEVNLQMARHTIDVLGLLRDKTKGNLDPEEQKLLDTLLYETRMQFVQKSGGAEPSP